ncbi:MAG: transposase [Chloroflexi bacterium]|nr:transposase [Chloroflexota bacterium]
MCRYGARGALAEERLERREDGRVAYRMKRLRRPPTSRRFLPPTSAHCMQRLRMEGSMWRVKASSAS